jgi:threonine aldolase
MYYFLNDYQEGCHPRILEKLLKSNSEIQIGYGNDEYSTEAVNLIKLALGDNSVDVHLVSGGTQANMICLSAFMRPHHSVISCDSGHINTHECGAIEATAHKINVVPSIDGKLTCDSIEGVLQLHSDEHLVKPKVVYISNSTELGTLYSHKELLELRKFTKEKNLYLFMDGARLGSALTSEFSDLTFKDITQLTDAFYIGGTKNGALLGEAIVICNDNLKEDFRYFIKQKGGLLAKGRLLGIQFAELFKDNLYLDLAKHARSQAKKMAEAINSKSYSFLTEPVTNQLFPIFPLSLIEKLEKDFKFYRWQKQEDNLYCIRLVTSWATTDTAVEKFIEAL